MRALRHALTDTAEDLPGHSRSAAGGDAVRMTELRDRWRHLPKAPVEGWISLAGILVLTLALAWSIDDAAWVLGRDHFRTPGLDGRVGGRHRVHRREGRLGALADLSRRVAPCRAHRAALRRRRPAARSDLGHPVPGDRNVARRGVARPRPPQPVGHPGVRPLPADARAVHVGDRDVRRLHDVRPSAAAERDRARRHRPRREHGLHVPQPAHAARAVQPRRALPAHPVPRLRRGVRVAAASHRRPVGRVGAVPARRLGVHRRRRRRVALPHQHRIVGAARRGGPRGG